MAEDSCRQLRPRKAVEGSQATRLAHESSMSGVERLRNLLSDDEGFSDDDAVADVERVGDRTGALAQAKEKRRQERMQAKAARPSARKSGTEKKSAVAHQHKDGNQRTLDATRDGTINLDAALAALHQVEAEADESAATFDFDALLAAEREDDERDDDEVFDVNKALGFSPLVKAPEPAMKEPEPGVSDRTQSPVQPDSAPSRPLSTRFVPPVPTPGANTSPVTPAQRNFVVKAEEKKDRMIEHVGNTAFGQATAGVWEPVIHDGSFSMYWIDAREQPHFAAADAGSVMLFGRTKCSDGLWRSCCLRVTNHMRSVLCAPKPGATEIDIVQEITAMCREKGISERRVKEVDRWYAFEEEDTPRDKSTWYKLRYPASFPPLFEAASAQPSMTHIQRMFGVGRSLIEQFLVKRQFKGPSHVAVQHAEKVPQHERLSHCEVEMIVRNPKFVTPVPASPSMPAPSLRAVSVQLHAQLDPQKNVNEIFGIGLSFMHLNPDGSTRSLAGCEHLCAFRPPPGCVIPLEFPKMAEAAGLRSVRTFGNEAALLNWATMQLKQHDPDILVGHNFLAFTLDVLLHRLAANRIADWSVIGRLRLRTMPKLQSGAGGTREATYQEREVCVGRLVLDTYLLAREHHRSTNYKLVALARELHLTGLFKNDVCGNTEEQPDLSVKPSWSAERLLDAVTYCVNLSLLALALSNKLDLVPLTKGLCCLAGNLWSRTLTGSRSERIEYLLLHAFHREKFVTPDRRTAAAIAAAAAGDRNEKRDRDGVGIDDVGRDDDDAGNAADVDDNTGGGAALTTKRKAKYQGGMVLEPKTGLYKEYILLLDFNSLYPSIIQEFDICFTTIKRRTGENPSIPTADDLVCPSCRANPAECPATGTACRHRCILPKVIQGLVASRRQVKKLMTTERDPAMLSQLEIRQKALKLTANSMYGCLGFEFSRFYAQQLAELVTEKGREALAKACEIVDGTQLEDGTRLDVIYGDTDSVMIRTQQRDLKRVREIAERIRLDVNKRYTKLEIGIDGVFCSMLLHKKKKYAALTVEDFMGEGRMIKREVKGLDMVRRDWCPLTKMACSAVLNALLDHAVSAEDAVEFVMRTMGEMAVAIRGGSTYELPLFCVSKSLTRDPEHYKDTNQPHVQVALRMKSRNEQVRSGDLIPYVVCNEAVTEAQQHPQQGPASARLASRSYHVDEVKKNPSLTIDVDWYLATQILPPVARLCEHVDGFTTQQLAEAMGVAAHVAATATVSGGATGAVQLHTGGTDMDYSSSSFRGLTLEDAYPLAEPLFVPCRRCHNSVRLHPHERVLALVDEVGRVNDVDRSASRRSEGPDGRPQSTTKHPFRVFLYQCTFCKHSIDLKTVSTYLMIALHKHRAAFYATGGDDAAADKVRQQLLYLRALFDVPRHFDGYEQEAHYNVLRLWDGQNAAFRALADLPRLTLATRENVSNEPLNLITEAYEHVNGSVVNTGELFRGMVF